MYKNKIRYHFREKKNTILSWENLDNNKSLSLLKRDKWRNSLVLKKKTFDRFLYKTALLRFNKLSKNIKNKEKNWVYKTNLIVKKKPFISNTKDRKAFWDNIITCLNTNDSLYYIKNNLFYLLENNTNFFKHLNVLNFNWLIKTKQSLLKNKNLESNFTFGLKSIFNGFIQRGLKRQCEKKFTELLFLLKNSLRNIDKSILHIFLYIIEKIKPFLGFRRKRLGRMNQKKKDVRYFYRIYHHNLRWQNLILKRLIFNSPFYIKRTKIVSIQDIYKGLMASFEGKGPIIKGLLGYYKLIGLRTPYAKRKKKKKRQRRNS